MHYRWIQVFRGKMEIKQEDSLETLYATSKIRKSSDSLIIKSSQHFLIQIKTVLKINTGSGRSKACLSVVGRIKIWCNNLVLIWTFHLKCHMVCSSVILLCYRVTCLWFYNKRGHYLCCTLYKELALAIFNIYSFTYLFLFIYLERKGRRKRGRETSMCGCLSQAPYCGPGLQPRHVPWLGIKPTTLWFTGQCSIHWPTHARAHLSFSVWKH